MKRINPLNSIDSTVFSNISWTTHFHTKKRSIRVDFEEIESFNPNFVKIVYSSKSRRLVIKKRKNNFQKS